RDVRSADERDLGPGDRPDAEVLRRVRELERAVDPVVVGQRERRVAELGCFRCELLRLRGPVEERIGAVGVQLDVAHPDVLHEHTFVWNTWGIGKAPPPWIGAAGPPCSVVPYRCGSAACVVADSVAVLGTVRVVTGIGWRGVFAGVVTGAAATSLVLGVA